MPRYLTDEDVYTILTAVYHHHTDIQHKALRDAINSVPTADVVEKARYDRLLENATIISEALNKYQTADVVERKKGKWAEKEVMYIKDTKDVIDAWQSCKCSECGRYDTRPYMYFFSDPRFCSYCGAMMEGSEE